MRRANKITYPRPTAEESLPPMMDKTQSHTDVCTLDDAADAPEGAV